MWYYTITYYGITQFEKLISIIIITHKRYLIYKKKIKIKESSFNNDKKIKKVIKMSY